IVCLPLQSASKFSGFRPIKCDLVHTCVAFGRIFYPFGGSGSRMATNLPQNRIKLQQISLVLLLTSNNLLLTINKSLQFATKLVLFGSLIAARSLDLGLKIGGMPCALGWGLPRFRVLLGWRPPCGCVAPDRPGRAAGWI